MSDVYEDGGKSSYVNVARAPIRPLFATFSALIENAVYRRVRIRAGERMVETGPSDIVLLQVEAACA
ncbi:MAG: hypothetical protein AAFU55_10650 [Pseudomonadota bacterium]